LHFTPFKENQITYLLKPLKEEPFAFLETARFDEENKVSYLFSDFEEILSLRKIGQLEEFFKRAEEYLERGYWLVGFLSYELGYLLEPKLNYLSPKEESFPFAWFGVCRKPLLFRHEGGIQVNPSGFPLKEFKVNNLKPNITEDEYSQAIQRIKTYIEAGDTYQVNFTYKYKFEFQGDILHFYLYLRRMQPTPYMAFIYTGDEYLLSFSPELFFRLNGSKILVEPMKGTSARGKLLHEDEEKGKGLREDEKNRAENLMIVDLLRNDLGRISKIGTVRVRQLFKVQNYRTVWQMTSEIEADLLNKMNLKQILYALFPSGSVTGAPKIRTMQIIHELEKEPRRVYTGAIGYISPLGRACFNVAIRTLLIKGGKGELGIGGGIVYDSIDKAEFKEANLKASFFIKGWPRFSLIETMRWDRENDFYLLDLHLNRLNRSARYFQIPLDLEEARRGLFKLREEFRHDKIYKVRLLLDLEGQIQIDYEELDGIRAPLRVKLSNKRVDPEDIFLYHKTTNRSLYDEERRKALAEGFFEVIFLNKRGELTEGSISNIFIEKGGILYTPPLSSGLLPGVFREHLIKSGKAEEKVLYPKDLFKADKVYIGNSVRGLMEVEFVYKISL
jgi:para-aminobenzoate synthetase/4-amino-4-deoxychorismate lyase